MIRPTLAAAIALLALAGCGGDDEETTAPTTTTATAATGATGGADPEAAGSAGGGTTVDIEALTACLDDAGLAPGAAEEADLSGESAQSISITAGDIPDNGKVYVFESEEAAEKAADAPQLSINVFEETVGAVTAVLVTAPSGSEGDEAKQAISDCISG